MNTYKDKQNDDINIEKALSVFRMDKNTFNTNKFIDTYNKVKNKMINIEDVSKRNEYLTYIEKCKSKVKNYYQIENILPEVDHTYEKKLDKMEHPYIVNTNNHTVIDKQNIDILDSFPNRYPKGFLNPVRRKIINRYVVVDSKFRTNYYTTSASNFSVQLNEPLKNVISMRLASFDIPNTTYVFSDFNKSNTFTIIDASEVEYAVDISQGNYDISSIIPEIELDEPFLSGRFSITIDETTQKTTITDNSGLDFILDFANTGESCYNKSFFKSLGYYLGFRKSYYSGSSSYTSEGVFSGDGITSGFIAVDDFQRNQDNTMVSNFTQSVLDKNILARFILRNGRFTIFYNSEVCNNCLRREYFGPVDIEKLHIRLLDEFGDEMDLNFADYSVSFNFEILYT